MIYEKLLAVQTALKAPKNQYNSFGKYKYRSCEDVLEAVKPLCKKNGLVLNLSDMVVLIGDRYYVQAKASVIDIEDGAEHHVYALAREQAEKKAMDSGQVTGTASSYARKYALNGLFCIDDTKDADTDEHHRQTTEEEDVPEPKTDRIPNGTKKATKKQISDIKKGIEEVGYTVESILESFPECGGDINKLTNVQAIAVLNKIDEVKKMKEKANGNKGKAN